MLGLMKVTHSNLFPMMLLLQAYHQHKQVALTCAGMNTGVAGYQVKGHVTSAQFPVPWHARVVRTYFDSLTYWTPL